MLLIYNFFQSRYLEEERRNRIVRLWERRLELNDSNLFLQKIEDDDKVPYLYPDSFITIEIQSPNIFGEEFISDGESSDEEQCLAELLLKYSRRQNNLLIELLSVTKYLSSLHKYKSIELSYFNLIIALRSKRYG